MPRVELRPCVRALECRIDDVWCDGTLFGFVTKVTRVTMRWEADFAKPTNEQDRILRRAITGQYPFDAIDHYEIRWPGYHYHPDIPHTARALDMDPPAMRTINIEQRLILQSIHESRGTCAVARRIVSRANPPITPERFDELRDELELRPRRIMRSGLDAAYLTPKGRADLVGLPMPGVC